MSKFWDLVERSIVFQGLITIALIAVVIYLTVTGQEVPDLIEALTLLVVGFYFGSKVENISTRQVTKKLDEVSKLL